MTNQIVIVNKVLSFCRSMLFVLLQPRNLEKRQWWECEQVYLFERLEENKRGLFLAFTKGDALKIRTHAIDVANYAMMITDSSTVLYSDDKEAIENLSSTPDAETIFTERDLRDYALRMNDADEYRDIVEIVNDILNHKKTTVEIRLQSPAPPEGEKEV